MVLAEPMGKMIMHVKYRLTAQLEPVYEEDWVAELPKLKISIWRYEKYMHINRCQNVDI